MTRRIAAALGIALLAACAGNRNPPPPPPPPDKPPTNANCNAFRMVRLDITEAHVTTNDHPDIKDLSTEVCREDMIGWHFVNTTTRPVTIKLSDFHVCGYPDKGASAVKFKGGLFDDDSDGTVNPKRSVTLVGRIKEGAPGCVNYTIRLNSAVHDPRLVITDP